MDAPRNSLSADLQTLRTMLHEREAQLRQRDDLLRERESALALRQAQMAEQQQTIEQLQRLNQGLSHRLDIALRRLYGRSAEKIDPQQLLLFGQAMAQAADRVHALAHGQGHPEEEPSPRSKGHGRRRLSERYPDLPRHRLEHPVAPEDLICPCCDRPRVRIGEDVSEQLDYVPASLFVIQHVRPKLACPHCEEGGVVTAQKPVDGQVIDKGLPGPGLVAHVITSKYADHQPLYRLEGMLARHGVDLARSTMCGWMKGAADLAAPLVALMASRIRQSTVLHTDDTPVPVQDPGRGQTKTGRLWVYLGDDHGPYTVFDYTASRRRDGPHTWLKDYQGYLQADAFGGYDGIYATQNVVEVACWAHARRKFFDARATDSPRAHHALAMIRLLYDVERQAKDLDAPDRLALRQQRAVPVLTQLHDWLQLQRDQVLPKSPMGAAITYALNQGDALVRYATDAGGVLAIDNNRAERAIRPLAVGRKNFLFLGSDTGGRTAAILYSLVASAKRHGLDPFVYLRDVLARIGATPISQLEPFLPDRWRQQQLDNLTAA